MNQRLFLSLACFLLLISLVAVAVLAATVTCPSSCSCLMPAEAKKIGCPGYCQGRQAICGYDTQKNEKYCYEKPATTTMVPQRIITVQLFVTPAPATIAPQECESGCTCLSTSEGKAKGLEYCNRQMTVCGKDISGAALYCFSKTVALTATTRPPVIAINRTKAAATIIPVAACPAGCSCLPADKADAAGLKQCSGSSAACSTGLPEEQKFCYETGRAIQEGNAAVSNATYPASGMPLAGIRVTPVPTAPAAGGGIVSQILDFFNSFFGAPRTGAPSQIIRCSGILTNIMIDPVNCGGCGNRCPEIHPNVCCGGTCFDFYYDANNCGGCGQVCPDSTICCEGTCTYYLNDTRNCGWCNIHCGEREVCSCGHCVNQDEDFSSPCISTLGGIVAAVVVVPLAHDDDDDDSDLVVPCTNATPCPQSWMTCCSDRCQNLNTSVGNCGSCGYVCPASPYCSGGTCTNLSPLA